MLLEQICGWEHRTYGQGDVAFSKRLAITIEARKDGGNEAFVRHVFVLHCGRNDELRYALG